MAGEEPCRLVDGHRISRLLKPGCLAYFLIDVPEGKHALRLRLERNGGDPVLMASANQVILPFLTSSSIPPINRACPYSPHKLSDDCVCRASIYRLSRSPLLLLALSSGHASTCVLWTIWLEHMCVRLRRSTPTRLCTTFILPTREGGSAVAVYELAHAQIA